MACFANARSFSGRSTVYIVNMERPKRRDRRASSSRTRTGPLCAVSAGAQPAVWSSIETKTEVRPCTRAQPCEGADCMCSALTPPCSASRHRRIDCAPRDRAARPRPHPGPGGDGHQAGREAHAQQKRDGEAAGLADVSEGAASTLATSTTAAPAVTVKTAAPSAATKAAIVKTAASSTAVKSAASPSTLLPRPLSQLRRLRHPLRLTPKVQLLMRPSILPPPRLFVPPSRPMRPQLCVRS